MVRNAAGRVWQHVKSLHECNSNEDANKLAVLLLRLPDLRAEE